MDQHELDHVRATAEHMAAVRDELAESLDRIRAKAEVNRAELQTKLAIIAAQRHTEEDEDEYVVLVRQKDKAEAELTGLDDKVAAAQEALDRANVDVDAAQAAAMAAEARATQEGVESDASASSAAGAVGTAFNASVSVREN